MTVEEKALERFHESARRELESYISRTNQIIGVTGFGFALGCVGLKLPSLYALLSFMFVVLLWTDGLKDRLAHFSSLRRAGDPDGRWWVVLWRARIALIGSSFLGLVTLGLVGL